MSALLAILIALFVTYALYEIFQTVNAAPLTIPTPAAAAPLAVAQPAVFAPAPADMIAPKPAPASPPPAVAAVAPAPAAAVSSQPKIVNLKNPETGEVSPVPNNYRFAKKWVKEALVKEGLLKKIYKNSELTETVSPKVKEAIELLKQLPQYQA